MKEKFFGEKDLSDNSSTQETKSSKRVKARKSKVCKTCSRNTKNLEKRNLMRFLNLYDQELAKNYCKDHETKYGDHKCEPIWCEDCGFLIKYEIEI